MGTAASIIQTSGALGFLLSVVYDHRQRFRLNEQERKDAIMRALQALWTWSPKEPSGMTAEEAAGLPSPRQIEFFNTRLRDMGELWTYPYPRVGWWDDGKVLWSISRKIAIIGSGTISGATSEKERSDA